MLEYTREQVEDAKKSISEEFVSRFYEFADDAVAFGTTTEFGRKYGIYFRDEAKAAQRAKPTLANIAWFQQNIYCGRNLPAWEKAGYPKQMIWMLHKIGFLSEQYNSGWQARVTGTGSFYYISQATAKEIFRQYKR